MNIDEILKATEGYTPVSNGYEDDDSYNGGSWLDIDVDDGELLIAVRGDVDEDSPDEPEWDTASEADMELVRHAPALRAEVLRLRERDAAWRYAYEHQNEELTSAQWDAVLVDGEPDPVALAKALGWEGVE